MLKLSQKLMKKALGETKTLCAGCSKAEPKFFAPQQTPFPRAQDGRNLISRRWYLPLPTNPVWWGSMHAISSYCGNRPTHIQTNKHSHKPTNRQDRLQYTAPLSLAQSVNIHGWILGRPLYHLNYIVELSLLNCQLRATVRHQQLPARWGTVKYLLQ